jgi:protein SCO1/2
MIRFILCMMAALIAATANADALRAGAFDPPRQAPELALNGSNGTALNLSAYRGKAIVLGFGFTSCTNVCPVTLAVLAQARKQLGPQANDVQVVYVTVDPERDTAAQLKKYLSAFDPTFVGGTGSPGRLAAVRKEYGISAEKKVIGDSYFYNHSSFTYLIDREGRIRALMPFGSKAEDYAHDLKVLLK